MSNVTSEIKKLLINRVNALSSTQAVYGYEEDHPSGWPVVFITPANMDGEFIDTTNNRRVYSFSVLAAFPTGQNLPKDSSKNKIEYAEDVINQVLDDIINDIDTNFELDGVTVLWVGAADSDWGFIDYEGGKARACRITLKINTDFQVRSS